MKIFLLFLVLFSGCAELQKNPVFNTQLRRQPPTIRNQNCVQYSKFRVMQILDHGVLAHTCPDNFPSYYNNSFDACLSQGDLFYIPLKRTENDYVDDQKVTLSDDKCIMENGTYQYYTKDELKKTVRQIRIIDSEVPNPRYKSEE